MESSDNEDGSERGDEINQPQGRKRTRNVEMWKATKHKHARLAGESYTSSTSGNIKAAKKTGPPCL